MTIPVLPPEDVVSGGATSAGNSAFLLDNATIICSRSGNAETFSLKTAAGTNPSASDPVRIAFRNTTGDGFVVREVTAALSVTISSGSTLGIPASTPTNVWVTVFDDAGTLRLGVIVCGVYPLQDNVLESSTAEGGAGGADSAGVFYTGAAVTSKAMRVLWRYEYSLATPGTWNTAPTNGQPYGQGIRLPGEVIQRKFSSVSSHIDISGTIPVDDTIPQNTEGGEVTTVSITPRSAASKIRLSSYVGGTLASTAVVTGAIFIDSTADALVAQTGHSGNSGLTFHAAVTGEVSSPGTSQVTYKLRAGASTGNFRVNGSATTRRLGGVASSWLAVEEIAT